MTPHAIQQANTVAALLEQQHSRRAIAEALGCSEVRISQIITHTFPVARRHQMASAALRAYQPPLLALSDYRRQMVVIHTDATRLLQAIETELRILDEELAAIDTDRLLGLRE